MSDRFDIVFVCTGNRFRSPIAAAAFAAAAADHPVRVHSLGMLDMRGAPALPEALRICSSLGLDLSNHRSRRLSDLPLGGVDLVIGFERKHVVSAVVHGGAPPERSFLLAELVETLEASELPDAEDAVARARCAVALVGERRPEDATSMSIPDPYGASDAEYERTAAHVRDLAARLAALLFGRDDG